MCHVSHLYETGASLYFTLLARQREGAEIEQWRAVKRAAGDAIARGTAARSPTIMGSGATTLPWLERELGARASRPCAR